MCDAEESWALSGSVMLPVMGVCMTAAPSTIAETAQHLIVNDNVLMLIYLHNMHCSHARLTAQFILYMKHLLASIGVPKA